MSHRPLGAQANRPVAAERKGAQIGFDRWREASSGLRLQMKELSRADYRNVIIITVWTTTVMMEGVELGGGCVYCGARLCESDIGGAAAQKCECV